MKMNGGLFKKIGYGIGGVVVAAAIYFGFLKDDKKYIESRKEEDPEFEEEEDAEDFKEA